MKTATPLYPTTVVRNARRAIDKIADRNRRLELIHALGCIEPIYPDKAMAVEMANAGKADRGLVKWRRQRGVQGIGAALLSAMDAFDRACARGTDDEIVAAGNKLALIWHRVDEHIRQEAAAA